MESIAILASHNGSGFEAIQNAIISKRLKLKIEVLISNNSDANALKKALNYGIETFVVNKKNFENPDEKIYDILKEKRCKYIFLSGYMKKLSPLITQNFLVINSHPALLPKFGGAGMYGRFVHEAVLEAKESQSGVTIHEVNENYDEGKILLQKKLQIADNETVDTLEQKIKELEKESIVRALELCLK